MFENTKFSKYFYISLLFALSSFLHLSRAFVDFSQNDASKMSKMRLREREKMILDDLFSITNYDKMIRPLGENGTGPTIVKINLFVRSIETIDDIKMEYKVQLTFREQWIDDRLKYSHLNQELRYLTLTEASKIWMPDLFYSNEKEGHIHKNLKPNLYIRIFPNGEVLYSIRISLTLACPMQLRLYPLDKQECTLRMASYGWTTVDLVFEWKKEGKIRIPQYPVQMAQGIQLFKFVLEEYTTSTCDSHTATGVYSCLRADFRFFREFRYYMINIYLPSCLLIIVSWVSFWIDPNSVPARVTLGVTTLLAISNLVSRINSSLPPVSYMKALDVWTGVSLTFVFAALLEFSFVNYASRGDKQRERLIKERKDKEKKHKKASPKQDIQEEQKKILVINDEGQGAFVHAENFNFSNTDGENGLKSRRRFKKSIVWPKFFSNFSLKKFPSRSKRIDILARIGFPILFGLFNIAYWMAYLQNDFIRIGG